MRTEQIKAFLDIACEGADYLAQTVERGAGDSEAQEILQHLREIAVLLAAEIDGSGFRQQIHLYAMNLQASIDDLCARPALYERIIRMEIRPFVMEMQRLWGLATEILATDEGRLSYRNTIMERVKALHDAPRKEYEYDVSILLLAYNKLEYTKCAAESILKHTDFSRGNVELILLNNGSEDDTRKYFESLPYAKVINLKHNILGTYAYTHILKGRYFIGFSNDVVATPHWLEHMLACVNSDDRIAMAVPVCNEGSISNDQGVAVPYPNTFAGMNAMQQFATSHNQMNPALWEDRSQLMTFLAILRSDLIGLCAADPIYTRAEFVDDDMSTLLRRGGWRQILMKDTFMHHFGGVTLGEGRRKAAGNALDAMRRVYYKKWGVDAWDGRGGFPGAEVMEQWHTPSANERVLVLEPRFGDFACELFNSYRRGGFVPHMTAAVFDERYLPDTGYLFDETLTATRVEEVAAQSEGGYNIIAAGCYLDELPIGDVIADLEQLYGLLTPGGMLVLPVRNPRSAYELDCIMRDGKRAVYCGVNEVKPFSSIPDDGLLTALRAHPYLSAYRIQNIMFEVDAPLVEQLMRFLGASLENIEEKLRARMFFLGIRRES